MRQFEFIFGLNRSLADKGGSVATIGSFDGVHLGHQAILERLIQVARQQRLPSVAVIFEPQPQEYFAPSQAPPRLMRLREKVHALKQAGVDCVVCLKFDTQLRSLTADQFVDRVLCRQLAIKHLEIGDDFRFGCDRQGDFAKLVSAGQNKGFSVADCSTLAVTGERVSSTRIRSLLEQDDLDGAAALLGRTFSICGRVVYGKQLGRTIGAPTANIGLGRYQAPVTGVYAIRAEIAEQQEQGKWCGVANVGVKPTVDGNRKPILEVHLFDFDQDIYGQSLKVEFCAKIRREQKFASLDALKTQIHHDMGMARNFFRL